MLFFFIYLFIFKLIYRKSERARIPKKSVCKYVLFDNESITYSDLKFALLSRKAAFR